MSEPNTLQPGLAMIHSNRMEDLREMFIHWCRTYPLPPFEREIILAQSNGIAQWLKLGLAADEGLGICAGVSFDLPARFLWQLYRSVLKDLRIPEASPFDREPLTWRIYQQLPQLIAGQPDRYAPLQRFMADDSHQQKRYQLAEQLAGLYDQYQVHRPDWLRDWKDGKDTLMLSAQAVKPIPLPDDQNWQPHLWRALFADLPESAWQSSRVFLNERLIATLAGTEPAELTASGRVPARLIVFGISSLPRETLRAITMLGTVSQVLFFVQNPCQHYWADLIEGKELLAHEARRQARKATFPVNFSSEDLHLHGNPLLAAWGKQGRDFVRLLDEWDQPEAYRDWFKVIDHYVPAPAESAGLLQQVQNAILNLDPLPTTPEQRGTIAAQDDSIVFHLAHSPQREVEILHDQLLGLFDQPTVGTRRCEPKDVVVMVPDIDRYAPHIEAVFGQHASGDKRQIPYSLADRRERGHNPIHVALEYLLDLPEARLTATEVLKLLDLAAIRQRLGLEVGDLPLLRRWIQESGIRWGLDGDHRKTLLSEVDLLQNTWQFGLDRLLLGYSTGDGAVYDERIAPYPHIRGIESERLGPLCLLLEQLQRYRKTLAEPAAPEVWGERLRALLADFFSVTDASERQSLERLHQALDQWLQQCEAAGLTEAIPVQVLREAWLGSIDQPQLTQRFLAGRVNFCTLMPMRSIPFRVICLLGMNDGQFPRSQPERSFDLMSRPGAYRPGDRARRDDDRYMFLEALLSARERLYISWVGRSIRDDSQLPPSVLIQQLRDYLEAGWMLESGESELLTHLTIPHPLQPFSPAYFGSGDKRLFSYAREWQTATPSAPAPEQVLGAWTPPDTLTLNALQAFVDKPVQYFFNQRLGVFFEDGSDMAEDNERFALDFLESHQLGSEFIRMKLRELKPGNSPDSEFKDFLRKQSLQGELPLGSFGTLMQQNFRQKAEQVVEQYKMLLETWGEPQEQPVALDAIPCKLPNGDTIVLQDWLTDVRVYKEDDTSHCAVITTRPSAVLDKAGKIKHHYLIRLWVQHVVAHAAGRTLTSYLVGEDRIIVLEPLADTAMALNCLHDWVTAWYIGQQEPLPVARKTAFAWLTAKKDKDDKAREAYEEGYQFSEVSTDAYLQRAYPTADDLLTARVQGQGFEYWVEQLYQPLLQVARVLETT